MSLRLKRWIYRLNQHEIVLECGYALWGWAQARLLVDGQPRAEATGCRLWPLSLETRLDDVSPAMPLRARITPGFASVHNELWAYGVPLPPPDRALKGRLDAPRGAWPEAGTAARRSN